MRQHYYWLFLQHYLLFFHCWVAALRIPFVERGTFLHTYVHGLETNHCVIRDNRQFGNKGYGFLVVRTNTDSDAFFVRVATRNGREIEVVLQLFYR